MEDIRSTAQTPHTLTLENREALRLTGVSDVDSFDEQTVAVFTDLGELTVRGSGLHINKLSLDTGELSLDGRIDSLSYSTQGKRQSGGGFLANMFR